MWYAGIDWADEKHDIMVIDDAGHQVGKRQVRHTVEGLKELTDFLQAIGGPQRKAELACIVETNHGLLITTLLEAGLAVYPVNPNTIDRRRSAAGAKTESIDAYLLAKVSRADFAEVRRLTPDSPIIAERKRIEPRPGQFDPDANPLGERAHGLPQSLLPSGLAPVELARAAFDADLSADVSHPSSGDGSFDPTD